MQLVESPYYAALGTQTRPTCQLLGQFGAVEDAVERHLRRIAPLGCTPSPGTGGCLCFQQMGTPNPFVSVHKRDSGWASRAETANRRRFESHDLRAWGGRGHDPEPRMKVEVMIETKNKEKGGWEVCFEAHQTFFLFLSRT